MATYLTGNNTSGLSTVVAVRIRNSDNNFWNTSTPAFEAYNASNIANYAISCTEIGSTGIYRFLDPSDTSPGTYLMIAKAGGSLAVSDLPNLFWTDNCGPRPANVTQTLGTTSAGTAGYMGIDWSNINAPTSTVALSNTTIGSSGGTVSANVTQWNGINVATPATAGIPEVNIKNISGNAVSTSTAQLGVNVVNIKGTASAGAAGYMGVDWGNVNSPTTTVELTGTTISTNQSIASVSGSVGLVNTPVILPPIPPNWITAVGIEAAALNGKGDWLVSTSYPANFANLAITSSGYVTVGTNLDKTGYSVTSGSVSFIFGSTIPVVIYPVSQSGAISLIRSTDYFADDFRALEWTDMNSIWPVLTGASINLLANYTTPANVATVLSLAGSVVVATGSSKQVQVEVPAASISAIGSGTYSVTATLADGHLVELCRGPFQVLSRP